MIHAHIFKIFYITFYSSHWIYFSCLIFRGTKQSFHSNICIGDLPLRRNIIKIIYWISSVQSFSRVRLFETPWIAPHQASVSITNSQSLPKLMSIELVMPSNHLILCCPLLFPSVFSSIRVFSKESVLRIRWPKYWSFSFSISPSNEHSGLMVSQRELWTPVTWI